MTDDCILTLAFQRGLASGLELVAEGLEFRESVEFPTLLSDLGEGVERAPEAWV
jgi:hypothetical protein